MGENGDVDLVMIYVLNVEVIFVEKGYGVLLCKLMYNDFVVVGFKLDLVQII